MENNYSAVQIGANKRGYKALYDLHCRDFNVKGSIDSFGDDDAFDADWIGRRSTYPFIESLIGDVKTIFTVSSTFESEFLVIKYDKSKRHTRLINVSHDGHIFAL